MRVNDCNTALVLVCYRTLSASAVASKDWLPRVVFSKRIRLKRAVPITDSDS